MFTITWSFGSVALVIITALVFSYAGFLIKELVEVRGSFTGSKTHFYDLGAETVYPNLYEDEDETDEEYAQAVAELNEYIAQKINGMNPILTDKIRNRFIPVTLKSVAFFAGLHCVQFWGSALFCILAVALVYGIVLVA